MTTQQLLKISLELLLVIAIWIGLRRYLRAKILGKLKLPNYHRQCFVAALRDRARQNPLDLMNHLSADNRRAFVKALWEEARTKVAANALRVSALPEDKMGIKRKYQESMGQSPASLSATPAPDEHLDVFYQRTSDALRIAIVMPDDPALNSDLPRARQHVKFFVLTLGATITGHATDLTGWTPDGNELYYNMEAPLAPEALARIVAFKSRWPDKPLPKEWLEDTATNA